MVVNREKDFYISCTKDSKLTDKEIGEFFKEVTSNIILIFDSDYALGVVKYLYNKDIFLLCATGETDYAKEMLDGGIFTKELVSILYNGIDNDKEFLSLNDIYLRLRSQLFDIQKPSMLTTNIVQNQFLSQNQFQARKKRDKEEVKKKSKSQIENLIGKGELDEGFKQLSFLIDGNEELRHNLILFKNRYSNLEDSKMLGIIESEKAQLENNQIVHGLLMLMKKI